MPVLIWLFAGFQMNKLCVSFIFPSERKSQDMRRASAPLYRRNTHSYTRIYE